MGIIVRIKYILNHSGFRRYLTNTSWLFVEYVLRIVAGFFVGVYVARYLGPEKFGIFSYAIAFVALFGATAKMGLDHLVVRDLTNNPERRDEYLGTAFWIKVIGAIATLGALGIAVRFAGNDAVTNLYIFIIAGGLIFDSFDVVDYYFQSRVLSRYVSICKMVQLGLSCMLKLYLIFIKADLFWFVLVILLDQASLAISLFFAYWRQNIGMFFSRFYFSTAKLLLKQSLPLVITSYSTMIFLNIDTVMIREMMGVKSTGLYAAAVKISNAYYFIPVIIVGSLFPAIINAKKVSQQRYLDRLQKLYNFMVWSAVAVAIPMTFFSDWLVKLLYGAVYAPAGRVLAIHVWGGVFGSLETASKKWFIIEGLQSLLLIRALLGAVCNVVLNWLLIPIWGIQGAALATVMSLAFAYVSYLFTPKLKLLFVMTTKSLFPGLGTFFEKNY